jgi:hypothetical protein
MHFNFNPIIMKNNLLQFLNTAIFILILSILFSSCSLLEREKFEYAFQEINKNEIMVDFQKINPGSWDTLLFVSPYATSEQIGLGYSDSEYLAFHSGADFYIIAGFLKDGDLVGYTLASKKTDFYQLFDDSDSVFVKKFPRTEAVFRFAKEEDGTYRLKK